MMVLGEVTTPEIHVRRGGGVSIEKMAIYLKKILKVGLRYVKSNVWFRCKKLSSGVRRCVFCLQLYAHI